MKINKLLRNGVLVTSPLFLLTIVSCHDKSTDTSKTINPKTFFDFKKPIETKDVTKLTSVEKLKYCQEVLWKIKNYSVFKNVELEEFNKQDLEEYGPNNVLNIFKYEKSILISSLFAKHLNIKSAKTYYDKYREEFRITENFEDYLTLHYTKMTKALEIYQKSSDKDTVSKIKRELNDVSKLNEIKIKFKDVKNKTIMLIDELLKIKKNENLFRSIEELGITLGELREKIEKDEPNSLALSLFTRFNSLIKNKEEIPTSLIKSLKGKLPKNEFDSLSGSFDELNSLYDYLIDYVKENQTL
ncbi:hypothetical protein NPA07_02235 [Mycoplasmopsis caviae]|uniref:Lipoprotein n=1 Tax=Mycoplasmopsis caviae TaxID=55603 RepID=A0A3P8L6H2_9BACT|nr:hypothetical protein [Mycoplasmopsis caviae]UUD35669.1 hypothetical protein NPA07_02235 [Mycoplasmopsis caviae]VDR41585.1 Uncharacterised protein [Mycoplasmopsis caviae]